MSRANAKGDLFRNDVDRQDFLKTLAEACQKTACDCVHLNPVRAYLLRPEQRLLECPWSSFGLYLAAPMAAGGSITGGARDPAG